LNIVNAEEEEDDMV